jgi:hypothetical protein
VSRQCHSPSRKRPRCYNASTLQTRRSGGVKASGCCFFGDDLGHCPMFRECPAFSSWDVSGGRRGLDLPPSPVRRKTDHGIPNPGTGTAGLAGCVRICGRADRYSPSGGRIPRQRGRTITPFADRLGPLIAPSLEPVSNCAASIGSSEHGHDGGNPQLGQPVRMRGIVGREIDREASRWKADVVAMRSNCASGPMRALARSIVRKVKPIGSRTCAARRSRLALL